MRMKVMMKNTMKTNNNSKKIVEIKSFKDQIHILKEIPWLNDY